MMNKNNKFSKRVFRMFLGNLCFTFLITLIVGSLVGGIALFVTREVSAFILKRVLLFSFLVFLMLAACVGLYAYNPKLWNTIHKSKNERIAFPLFALLPDICSIVGFLESIGTSIEENKTDK